MNRATYAGVLFAAAVIIAASYWLGYSDGRTRAAWDYINPGVTEQKPTTDDPLQPESVGATVPLNNDFLQGVLAFGIAREQWRERLTDSDYAVIRIDSATGRVLAKCE